MALTLPQILKNVNIHLFIYFKILSLVPEEQIHACSLPLWMENATLQGAGSWRAKATSQCPEGSACRARGWKGRQWWGRWWDAVGMLAHAPGDALPCGEVEQTPGCLLVQAPTLGLFVLLSWLLIWFVLSFLARYCCGWYQPVLSTSG